MFCAGCIVVGSKEIYTSEAARPASCKIRRLYPHFKKDTVGGSSHDAISDLHSGMIDFLVPPRITGLGKPFLNYHVGILLMLVEAHLFLQSLPYKHRLVNLEIRTFFGPRVSVNGSCTLPGVDTAH